MQEGRDKGVFNDVGGSICCRQGNGDIDTPRRKRAGIPGSTKPLRLDTLQPLAQRWDSPQATSGMPYPSWISPSSFLDLKQKRFKN